MSEAVEPRMLSARDSWRRKGGLVSWSYGIAGTRLGLRDRLIEVLDALAGFARPRSISITTASSGDDSAVVAPRAPAIISIFDELPDVVGVDFGLDLCVCDREGEAIEADAALIWLRLSDEADPAGALSLFLSLDVDLYAPVSAKLDSDNRELAALNGPRLTSFLQRLEKMGWVLQDVDAPYHPPGVVNSHGFVASGDDREDDGK